LETHQQEDFTICRSRNVSLFLFQVFTNLSLLTLHNKVIVYFNPPFSEAKQLGGKNSYIAQVYRYLFSMLKTSHRVVSVTRVCILAQWRTLDMATLMTTHMVAMWHISSSTSVSFMFQHKTLPNCLHQQFPSYTCLSGI